MALPDLLGICCAERPPLLLTAHPCAGRALHFRKLLPACFPCPRQPAAPAAWPLTAPAPAKAGRRSHSTREPGRAPASNRPSAPDALCAARPQPPSPATTPVSRGSWWRSSTSGLGRGLWPPWPCPQGRPRPLWSHGGCQAAGVPSPERPRGAPLKEQSLVSRAGGRVPSRRLPR